MIGIKKYPPANSQNPFRCDFYNLPGSPEFLPITLNEVECNEEMMRVVHGRLCMPTSSKLRDCRIGDTPLLVARFRCLLMLSDTSTCCIQECSVLVLAPRDHDYNYKGCCGQNFEEERIHPEGSDGIRVTSTLSIRLPSISTTSKRSPPTSR